jgi:hypothetical protein
MKEVRQTEFDMNKVFVSPREWAAFSSGVLMPTRCGNLLVHVMVEVEYKNPIFQLSF